MMDRAGQGQDGKAGRDRFLSFTGWAGAIGPVLFTAVFVGQELVRREEYDAVAETVSALEAGPHGWVQQVNFVVFGVLTCAFALGLLRGVAPRGPVSWAGSVLLFISGVGLLLAAAFPLREDEDGVTYDPGGHVIAGMTFFLGSALGLVVLSRQLRGDDRWRDLSPYTLACGVLALLAFAGMGTLVIPDDAPLHDWAGLVQRLLIVLVIFPCRVVLSLRLLALARRTSTRTTEPTSVMDGRFLMDEGSGS